MFQYDNVRGFPFTWNYVEICHCKVRLTCLLFVMIQACQRVTQCYWSLLHMSVVIAMQAAVIRRCMWYRSPVFFQCTQLFRYPHEKKSGDLGGHSYYQLLPISDPASVDPTIRQWHADLPHRKEKCLLGSLGINLSKCTLTEPKYPIRVICSQFV